MSKPLVKCRSSFFDGRVKVQVKADAYDCERASVAASISAELDLEAARSFHSELGLLIQKTEEKLAAKQASDERRKKWRLHDVAAGRIK